MLRIYLTNLGKYNEGFLIGEWLDLPATEEEIEEVKQRIGINAMYEEWFITDYETDIEGVTVGEYESISELNELAEVLEGLSGEELDKLEALLEYGCKLVEALERIDDCLIWFDCEDMEDVAREYCECTGLLDGIPENIANYFDFAAFGRDLSFEGTFIFLSTGNCVEIC
ncbi:MAG: antirestriction protein ArdA [Faecousia sp.]